MKLTQQETAARMTELRNLRKLHTAQKMRIELLKEENKQLKERVVFLESAFADQQDVIVDLKLQMEELRTIVFGTKRRHEDHDLDDIPPTQKPPRTSDSYRRPLPREDEVTETKDHPIDACAHCHGQLSQRETGAYFTEDIPLPQKKMVTKHVVEKGYCEVCRRWSTSVPLPTAPVILGENVKRYIVYLSVVCRQSYAQIQELLLHTYDFRVSEGEIAKIMEKEGIRLRPAYEQQKTRIRGEPSVHLDETTWNLTIGDGYRRYAWTMVGGESDEAIFLLGKTRGKGNASDLLGDTDAVLVSDDCAAYRTREKHQLCCAHILRKLRDLAHSGEITGEIHDHCLHAYTTFASIYRDIEQTRVSANPLASYDVFLKRLHTFARTHPLDGKKLAGIKGQIAARRKNYLTCLLYPGVAADNNAAERSLRHLVIKRKTSFGSFSEKTAETLAILLSVLMSFKRQGTLRNYLMGV